MKCLKLYAVQIECRGDCAFTVRAGGCSLASHQYFPHGTDPWDVFSMLQNRSGSGLFIPHLLKGSLICSENVTSNYSKIS